MAAVEDKKWTQWAPEEEQYLAQRLGKERHAEIAAALGRTVWAVRSRVRKLQEHAVHAALPVTNGGSPEPEPVTSLCREIAAFRAVAAQIEPLPAPAKRRLLAWLQSYLTEPGWSEE